jgi:hypothetical protein
MIWYDIINLVWCDVMWINPQSFSIIISISILTLIWNEMKWHNIAWHNMTMHPSHLRQQFIILITSLYHCPYHTIPYHAHITSHHIASHHITSHHITPISPRPHTLSRLSHDITCCDLRLGLTLTTMPWRYATPPSDCQRFYSWDYA